MTWFFLGLVLLKLLCLAFLLVLVMRIALGWRRHHGRGALAVLERRFVAGEITEEDFRHMRDVLE